MSSQAGLKRAGLTDVASKTIEPQRSAWRFPAAAAVTVILVAAADFLTFGYLPGINVALLFILMAVAIVLLCRRRVNLRALAIGSGALLVGVLPLIEAPTPIGILSGVLGLSVLALAASSRLPRSARDLPAALMRFATLAPFRLAGDGLRALGEGAVSGIGSLLSREVLTWIVPAIFALVFLLLFASANPLIEAVVNAVNLDTFLSLLDPWRILFWGIVAWFAWPFLRPRLLRWRKPAEVQGPVLPKAEGLIFGRAAILRSLIVFNALFAVQTAMDAAYLWGGVTLPDGMSYADYAHRGAYPLIVTALLAAGFVLAAMRRNGAAEQSRLIRNLVYLWIGQNVMLVISSILRLDLYVEVYSLTELRIAAGIWMGLVAIGLVLIIARIAFRESNKWLVGMNLGSLGLALYACAFLDFSAIISRFNVEHSFELTGKGQPLDLRYLQDLGAASIPALDYFVASVEGKSDYNYRPARDELAQAFAGRGQDWRSWNLRDRRLDLYLADDPMVASSVAGAKNRTSMP